MTDLTILGQPVRDAISAEQLETIDLPPGVSAVTFTTDEVTAFCPVTHQPDYYRVRIYYLPRAKGLESKALKLYLMSFRDRGIFAEALADEIAEAIDRAIKPYAVNVFVRQQPRGGLVLKAVADRVNEDDA